MFVCVYSCVLGLVLSALCKCVCVCDIRVRVLCSFDVCEGSLSSSDSFPAITRARVPRRERRTSVCRKRERGDGVLACLGRIVE